MFLLQKYVDITNTVISVMSIKCKSVNGNLMFKWHYNITAVMQIMLNGGWRIPSTITGGKLKFNITSQRSTLMYTHPHNI